MLRFLIAVHRVVNPDPKDPKSALGVAIDLATRVRWGAPPRGGYTYLDGPATHAFTVVDFGVPAGAWFEGSGRVLWPAHPTDPAAREALAAAEVWRIDAGPPCTLPTPVVGWELGNQAAAWEVLPGDTPWGPVDPQAGALAALQGIGTPYDWAQCLLQALGPALAAMPKGPKAPGPLGALQGAVEGAATASVSRALRADGGAVICTEDACRALAACGGPARILAEGVMEADHFPEELSRKAEDVSVLPPGRAGGWLRRRL